MCLATSGNVFIACDLSQAESWVVAHLANEINMKHALMYSDIHTESAKSIFPEEYPKADKDTKKVLRYLGKRNNHANSYGMEEDKGAAVINADSDKPPYVTVTVKEFKKQQDAWHAHYFGIKGWWEEVKGKLNIDRKLTTTYGRTRTFYAPWGKELWKEAYAFEPQSTVADHFNGMVHEELGIRGGLIEVDRQIVVPSNGEIKIVNQSHDSIMVECPQVIADEIAEKVMDLLHRPLVVNGEEFWIPVDCEIGERWGELEKYGLRHKYKNVA